MGSEYGQKRQKQSPSTSMRGVGVFDLHLRVEWNKKLPIPTRKYPMNETRNIPSWPFLRQFDMPFTARYTKRRFVVELTISAE